MKAVQYDEFRGPLRVVDVPEPDLPPHGAIIEIRPAACAAATRSDAWNNAAILHRCTLSTVPVRRSLAAKRPLANIGSTLVANHGAVLGVHVFRRAPA